MFYDRGVQIDELIGSFLGHKGNCSGICSACYFGKSTDPESEAVPRREFRLFLFAPFSWRVESHTRFSRYTFLAKGCCYGEVVFGGENTHFCQGRARTDHAAGVAAALSVS